MDFNRLFYRRLSSNRKDVKSKFTGLCAKHKLELSNVFKLWVHDKRAGQLCISLQRH